MSESSAAFFKQLKTIGKVTAGLASAGGIAYSGYKIGDQLGSNRTAKIMLQEMNNQQIAHDNYLRGLQEGQVEKTAQEIAKELLEKIAGKVGVLESAGKALGGYGKNWAESFRGLIAPTKTNIVGRNVNHRGMFATQLLKNPLTIGGGLLGGGAMIGGMRKESSDEARIAAELLEKIAGKPALNLKNIRKTIKDKITKTVRYASKHPKTTAGASLGVGAAAGAGVASAANSKKKK